MRDSLKIEAYKEVLTNLMNRGLRLCKDSNYSKPDFKDLVRELTLINQDIDDVNFEISEITKNYKVFSKDDLPF